VHHFCLLNSQCKSFCDQNNSCILIKWVLRAEQWIYLLIEISDWFLTGKITYPHPHPSSALVDWLQGRLLNWVVIQLRSSASVLLAGGDTLCMHEYITSAAVIIPGKTAAVGTCALLPLWLLCSYCHCHIIKLDSVLVVKASTHIRWFFISRKSQMFPCKVRWGKLMWWNIYKIEIVLMLFFITLKI